jgi:hypothetical protein
VPSGWQRWLVVVLAAAEAGWMLFDGTRALVVGDYVTPSTGEYAGQLGPWHAVVEALGIPARSTAMKAFFASYGAAWLVVVVAFARRRPWARTAMLGAAIGSLWYLVVGTLASALVLVLLALGRDRPFEGAQSRG